MGPGLRGPAGLTRELWLLATLRSEVLQELAESGRWDLTEVSSDTPLRYYRFSSRPLQYMNIAIK